jgi:hypothetical protein
LATGVDYRLDSRDRYAADRGDVAPALLDDIEAKDAGKENCAPELSPLILTEPVSELPKGHGHGRRDHRHMLSPRSCRYGNYSRALLTLDLTSPQARRVEFSPWL